MNTYEEIKKIGFFDYLFDIQPNSRKFEYFLCFFISISILIFSIVTTDIFSFFIFFGIFVVVDIDLYIDYVNFKEKRKKNLKIGFELNNFLSSENMFHTNTFIKLYFSFNKKNEPEYSLYYFNVETNKEERLIVISYSKEDNEFYYEFISDDWYDNDEYSHYKLVLLEDLLKNNSEYIKDSISYNTKINNNYNLVIEKKKELEIYIANFISNFELTLEEKYKIFTKVTEDLDALFEIYEKMDKEFQVKNQYNMLESINIMTEYINSFKEQLNENNETKLNYYKELFKIKYYR